VQCDNNYKFAGDKTVRFNNGILQHTYTYNIFLGQENNLKAEIDQFWCRMMCCDIMYMRNGRQLGGGKGNKQLLK